MAIQIRGITTGVSLFSSPRSTNKPTGVVAGDTLLLCVVLTDAITPSSVPSGFTLIADSGVTNTPSIYVYVKTAGGSEPSSYSVTFASGQGIVCMLALYSDTALPLVVDDAAAQHNASSTNRVWPSVTTTVANAFLACFGAIAANVPTTPDASMTEQLDNSSSTRNYLMTQTLGAAGVTGTRTGTGTAAVSATSTVAIAEDTGIAAPSGLTATAISTTQIDLTWTDNSDDEDNFEVERSADGSTGWTQIDTPAANATSYSDTGLTADTQYFYRVRAVNAGGNSAYTSVANATTFEEIPAAPSGLAAAPISTSQIDLIWTDNSDNEDNFILQRSLDGSTGWTQIATPAADATSYSDTGLNDGTTYYYRILATNTGGNSAWSNTASETTDSIVVPLAPSPGPFYLYFHVPAPVFRARVNYAAPSYPLTSIPYDNVTLGAYTDVQDGMFFTIGSTQDGDDKGRGRIQNPLTSTHIPVGRVSQGTHDGELDIDDNDYITVWNDFRIHAKIPYIADDGTMYKDNDVMIGDNTENPPPVANTGPGFAATVDSVTGLMEVDFDGGTSFATADGATITGFSWDVDDGTITVGTATDAQITATFPAGFRWVALTVTDSNGKTHTARCPVYGRDVQNDTTIEHYEITGHSIRPEGQRLSVRILEDMPRSTYPDGCLVMFWEDEPLSPSDRNHMQFVGWHQSDQVSVRATRTGNLRDTVLECVDVAGRLDTLPGFPQVINRADTPDKWTDMTNPTMDKFIHYILHWHSTALELADYFPSDTGDDYPFVIFQSSGESLYQQVDNEAKALVPDHRFTCNRRGQLAIVADPMLQNVADRTNTVQGTFTEEYTQEIRFNYTRPPRVHWVRGNAMLTATDYTDVDGVDTLFTLHNIAPGTTPGQGVSELTTNEQLARSQAALNSVTGHRYARLNSRYGLVTVTPPDSANYTHIDPATMDWVNFSVTADTAAQRGLTFTNVRTQCKEINVRYSDNGTGLVRTMTFTLEIETSGLPAETVIPPGTPEVPTAPVLPVPDYGLIEGQQQVAGIDLDGYIYRTSDFQTTSGSGGPTWDRVDMGITETIYSFVVDPFSPGYINGTGAINGWVASENAIYRIADIFGTPSVTPVHSFPTSAVAASYHWRSIQASFGTYFPDGENPWLLCISYYGDSSGHTGTWATYSMDGGVTWSGESQVSEFYDNGTVARFNPIGVYASPKTPGLAYTAAYTETASPALADGYVSTDWGATWARVSEDPVDDPDEPLPYWALVNENDTEPQAIRAGASFSHTSQKRATNTGATMISDGMWYMLMCPPANAVRVRLQCVYSATRTSTNNFSSANVNHSIAEKTSLGHAVTTDLSYTMPAYGTTIVESYFVEWTTAQPDWPGNRDDLLADLPGGADVGDYCRFLLHTAANSISASATGYGRITVSAAITEIELDDGTIYTPPALGSGIVQPGHAQAGSIHLPWHTNDDEQLAYFGNFDKTTNREFRLKQSSAGAITDISPVDTSISFGTNRYGFSIRAYDADRQYLLLAGIGNDTSGDASDDKHGIFYSNDGGATWTTIVAPVADSQAPAGRPAFEAAFSGDNPAVAFLWGKPQWIAYTSDSGATVDDRSGNLGALGAEGLIGIVGGPTGA